MLFERKMRFFTWFGKEEISFTTTRVGHCCAKKAAVMECQRFGTKKWRHSVPDLFIRARPRKWIESEVEVENDDVVAIKGHKTLIYSTNINSSISFFFITWLAICADSGYSVVITRVLSQWRSSDCYEGQMRPCVNFLYLENKIYLFNPI